MGKAEELLGSQRKMEILFALLEFEDGATAYDLSKKLSISVSPISQHLKKLEKSSPKLVKGKETIEEGRYKRIYVLTDHGKRTATDLMRKHLVKYASILGRLEEKRKVLEAVRQNLEAG